MKLAAWAICLLPRSRRALVLESLALRQQLATLVHNGRRPRLLQSDRLFWVAVRDRWPDRISPVKIVKPATGIRARVAKMLGCRRLVLDRQVALFAEIGRGMAEPSLTLSSFRSGWCYLTPRDARRTQLAVITDAEVLRVSEIHVLLREALQAVRLRLSAEDLGPVSFLPLISQLMLGTAEGFAAVGDAAWSPDPLSGGGVARAVEAAIRLGASGPVGMGPPISSALAHLRLRTRFLARTPWCREPYFRNRLRAAESAEDLNRGANQSRWIAKGYNVLSA